jgi:hypothetical protein
MSEYRDLIYYKQDVIDAYKEKRKGLTTADIEDLLNCAILFLEASVKDDKCSSLEIPNIGYLHRKLNFNELGKASGTIKKEDNVFVKAAYLDTKFSPLVTREDVLSQYYPQVTLEELQRIQNDK